MTVGYKYYFRGNVAYSYMFHSQKDSKDKANMALDSMVDHWILEESL